MVSLQEIQAIRLRCEALDGHIQRLRADAERTTMRLRQAPSGRGNQDMLGERMSRLLAAEAEWIAARERLEKELREVDQRIERLEEPHRTLMTLRYITGLSWSEIAKKMHYCPSNCYRLHNEVMAKWEHMFRNGVIES